MAYNVELTPRAAADADTTAEYIKQFAPEAAQRWFDGFMQAVLSLEEMPQRCPLAPEAERLGIELRQLLYGKRGGRVPDHLPHLRGGQTGRRARRRDPARGARPDHPRGVRGDRVDR
jgi:plasmid stabilization system protein ParE